MISRGELRPSGFVVYSCTECRAEWQVHVHEDPAVITKHSSEECAVERASHEELQALVKKHPNQRFAKSVMNGKWVPV